jgi:hypothetical protein
MPTSELETREDIRGIMRNIAREICRLPAPRQTEVSDRLLSMLRNLQKENALPVDRTSL